MAKRKKNNRDSWTGDLRAHQPDASFTGEARAKPDNETLTDEHLQFVAADDGSTTWTDSDLVPLADLVIDFFSANPTFPLSFDAPPCESSTTDDEMKGTES